MLSLHALQVQTTGTAGQQALHQPLDLAVAAGEIAVLVGANGIGKSSLLRLIGGESVLHSGRIDIDRSSIQISSRPQMTPLYFAIPVTLRDILAWRAQSGLSENAQTLIANIELDRAWDSASGGERQRVLIASSLTTASTPSQSQLLLLDEPTNHLDPATRTLVVAAIENWVAASDSKRSAVIASHDAMEFSHAKRIMMHEIGGRR